MASPSKSRADRNVEFNSWKITIVRILVDPRETWKTTRNLADYEGPLRRRRICRAVWPSLLSRTDIFGKIHPMWKDLSFPPSLSLSSARFCWRCEVTKDEKEERSRVLCEDDPCPRPHAEEPCAPHNGFGCVLSASSSEFSFLSFTRHGFSVLSLERTN